VTNNETDDYPSRKARALLENPHGLTFDEAMEAFYHYFTQEGRNELSDYLAHDMQRELGQLAISMKGMRGKGRHHLKIG
jgi:hypothetical protein